MSDNTTVTMTGKPSGFRSLVGYTAVVWCDGYAEIELDLGARHLNSLGIVHGGVYAALLDAAMGHAATWVAVKVNVRRAVTLSLTTTFVASVRGGVIKANGRLEAIDDRLGTCSGVVIDERGKLLAVGQASFRYAKGSERVEGVPRTARRT